LVFALLTKLFGKLRLKALASTDRDLQSTYVKEDALLLLSALAITIAVSGTTFYLLKMF